MLIVLCRFKVPAGKYFLKRNQQHSHCYLDNNWFVGFHKALVVSDEHLYGHSDSTAKLNNAMLQGSRCAIIYCWKAATIVSYLQEIIIQLAKNAQKFWNN